MCDFGFFLTARSSQDSGRWFHIPKSCFMDCNHASQFQEKWIFLNTEKSNIFFWYFFRITSDFCDIIGNSTVSRNYNLGALSYCYCCFCVHYSIIIIHKCIIFITCYKSTTVKIMAMTLTSITFEPDEIEPFWVHFWNPCRKITDPSTIIEGVATVVLEIAFLLILTVPPKRECEYQICRIGS